MSYKEFTAYIEEVEGNASEWPEISFFKVLNMLKSGVGKALWESVFQIWTNLLHNT